VARGVTGEYSPLPTSGRLKTREWKMQE